MDNIKVELKVINEYGNSNKLTSTIDIQKINSPTKEDLLDAFLSVLVGTGVLEYSRGDRVIILSEDIPNRSN